MMPCMQGLHLMQCQVGTCSSGPCLQGQGMDLGELHPSLHYRTYIQRLRVVGVRTWTTGESLSYVLCACTC